MMARLRILSDMARRRQFVRAGAYAGFWVLWQGKRRPGSAKELSRGVGEARRSTEGANSGTLPRKVISLLERRITQCRSALGLSMDEEQGEEGNHQEEE